MFSGLLKIKLATASGAVPLGENYVYVKTDGFESVNNHDFAPTYNVSGVNYNYRLLTDSSGITDAIKIESPDPALSKDRLSNAVPYAISDIYVNVPNYFPVIVNKIQTYAGETSVLTINLVPVSSDFPNTVNGNIVYNVTPNALLTKTEKQYESSPESASPDVLKTVKIPETISVHLGAPNENAENVYVSFTDYIKNVASSEIYPTWPDETLKANILAIISLTLNRIYTEWYPSQGYDFDITASTQYDHSFVYGRNIFENISMLVDELFNSYIVRTGSANPLFASYCDGLRTICPGLQQWGSEALGNEGFSAESILKRYYGDDIQIKMTDEIASDTRSYPGEPLKFGDMSLDVETIRRQLYIISFNYPVIPRINPLLSLYDSAAETAVRIFQEIFGLDVTGVVDLATWYKISYVYSSVSKLSELYGDGDPGGIPVNPPDTTIKRGDRGNTIRLLQYMLTYISLFYPSVMPLETDGFFGQFTEEAVKEFQGTFSLEITGVVTPDDWDVIYSVYNSILETVTPDLNDQNYPGSPLSVGDSGDNVSLMQIYLGKISAVYPEIPDIDADGIFGLRTKEAVEAFQRRFNLKVTGTIDLLTWEEIVEIYNFLTRTTEETE